MEATTVRNVALPEMNVTNPAQGIKMPPFLVTLPEKSCQTGRGGKIGLGKKINHFGFCEGGIP